VKSPVAYPTAIVDDDCAPVEVVGVFSWLDSTGEDGGGTYVGLVPVVVTTVGLGPAGELVGASVGCLVGFPVGELVILVG
jgi:hypothetical protein